MQLELRLLLALRSSVAVLLVAACISVGWYAVWKLVLVHIPLVQEVCGLRKKPPRPKPAPRRLANLYPRTRSPPSCRLLSSDSSTSDVHKKEHEP